MQITSLQKFVELERRHPHITTELKFLWGTQAGKDYILSLVYSTRTPHRSGFSKEMMDNIMWINDEHDRQFPQFAVKETIW